MQTIHSTSSNDSIYKQGACGGGEYHSLFFSDDATDLAAAQRICGDCPVRIDCLAGALQRREEWGVWGGVIFWDGEAFYRKRGRGRPRKNEAHLPLEADRAELWNLVRSA
jgi:WhiB family redox-sensing transcriptional regulator